MSIQRIRGRIHAFFASLALACLAPATPAIGASSFRIEQLYSNLDGSVQYIRMRESAGRDDEHRIGGLVITVTGNGVTKSVTIPRDLWWAGTAGQPVQISTGRVPTVCCGLPDGSYAWYLYGSLVATGPRGPAPSDFAILPERFLPTNGGSITLADVDTVALPPLPGNGYQAVDRDGRVVRAEVRSFVRSVNPFGVAFLEPPVYEVIPDPVFVREYHHAGLDHYFMSANAAEIDAIERSALAGWTLNDYGGFSVNPTVGPVPVARLQAQDIAYAGQAVCRYYLPPPLGDTHFFSASSAECAAVAAQLPGAVLESPAAFFVEPADPVTGACASDVRNDDSFSHKVYRLWNGRAQANHRYTMSRDERAAMIARGWRPEGHGPEGVAFCSLQPEGYYWPWEW